MRVVFITSECVPYASTGGLGDVASALPLALKSLGHDVCRIMPLYRAVHDRSTHLESIGRPLAIPVGYETRTAEVFLSCEDGIDTYFINREEYFDRSQLYGLPHRDYDDAFERSVFFQKSAVALLDVLSLDADIIHTHDWQTGLIGLYLRHGLQGEGRDRHERTVFTIHNLAYQGIYAGTQFTLTGLPYTCFDTNTGMEYYGQVCSLKAGIVSADMVTTVSRTYADEIRTDEGGRGMGGVLTSLGNRLTGIPNGINYDLWNPATDKAIRQTYDTMSVDEGKRDAKKSLQQSIGLPASPDTPLLVMVSRLAEQKGIDLFAKVMPQLMERDVQFFLLGSGEPAYHRLADEWQRTWPRKCASKLGFDAELAHRVYAGADAILVPSVFEPCGLSQLYAMRYGTIPIVHKTGGLADTVSDQREQQDGTGFQFTPYRADAFLEAIDAMLKMWRNPKQRHAIVQRAMARNSSWENSAREYIDLYQTLLD